MQINAPPAPAAYPPPHHPAPAHPPAAPSQPTVVVRPQGAAAPQHPPQPAAYAPQPATPAPASMADGATQYLDVRDMAPAGVVGVLVAVDGELEGGVYKLSDGENRLGRSPSCNVELASKKVSREHAKIIHQNGVFAIAPLSEQNPTLVNDERTEGGELRDGDYIKVGRTTLRFRSIV